MLHTALHMRLIDAFRMLTVVALSVGVRGGKNMRNAHKMQTESNNTTARCVLQAEETNLLWAMNVWFWKYYDCLNITYNLYSPNGQPFIKSFKMVGRMKTGELVLDVMVADIWGGGQWDKHKGSECQSLCLKDWRYKCDHWWLPTLPFKKVSLSLVCWKCPDLCSAPASEMTFICICLKAVVVKATEWCPIHIKIKNLTFWFTEGETAVGDSWQSHYPLLAEEAASQSRVRKESLSARTCMRHVESKGSI